jgi:uncharacterized protein (DUF488 family)
MTPRFVTIGVYGWEEEAFFQALNRAGVDLFCDLRARRGVRGSEYAFANSERLQARLSESGIRYLHFKELAPGEEIRSAQHTVDETAKVARRKRAVLSPAFVEAYRRERLAGFDSAAFVESLGPDVQTAALFCVEREPAACHRSLLAARLEQDLGVAVMHLLPQGFPDSSL